MEQVELVEFEAKIGGQPMIHFPKDLYIPPEAMRVILEAFEGPLDLLLYLIKKQNVDVLNIPIAEITRQYVQYIELMHEMHIELAAEYLVMAAMLAEIKSRMLLPRHHEEEPEESDPRAELIRRLQEYERFKEAAEQIDQLDRVEREFYVAETLAPPMDVIPAQPEVKFDQLLQALKGVMERAKYNESHHVLRETLSISDRIRQILEQVSSDKFVSFLSLFRAREGRMGVVVSLIAMLELLRQSVLELSQTEPFAPIYIKKRAGEHDINWENIDKEFESRTEEEA